MPAVANTCGDVGPPPLNMAPLNMAPLNMVPHNMVPLNMAISPRVVRPLQGRNGALLFGDPDPSVRLGI